MSNTISKPKWKGTPEMQTDADGPSWNEFIKIFDNLDELTALDMMKFHVAWYMKVGHTNLGRMYAAAVRAEGENSQAVD